VPILVCIGYLALATSKSQGHSLCEVALLKIPLRLSPVTSLSRHTSEESGLEHHCNPSNRSRKGAQKKGEGVRAPFPLYSLSFPVPPTAQVVATCGDALLSSVHVEAVVGVEGHKRGGEEAR
jgi:hypothetical protein